MTPTSQALISELKGAKIIDARLGHTRAATDLELRAAAHIITLEFQLSCRIEKAATEIKT